MKKAIGFLLYFSLMAAHTVKANFSESPPKTVTGTITDAKSGDALAGATITVESASTMSLADGKGQFSITVPADDAVVVISFVGYATISINVKGQSNIAVKLNKDTDVNSLS